MTVTTLLFAALRAALVLGLALAAMPLLRTASAATRRAVLVFALVAVVVLPIATAVLPSLHLGSTAAAPDTSTLVTASSPDPVAEARPIEGATTAASASAPAAIASETSWAPSPLAIVLALWALGAMAVLARLGAGLYRARRMAKKARLVEIRQIDTRTQECVAIEPVPVPVAREARPRCRSVQIRSSSEIDTPAVTGLFSPVILLPRDADAWTDERRELVIAHELAHVARRDCLANVLAQIAVAMHWFDPLAHLAARRLRIERELAADDRVLDGGAAASSYAAHLLALAMGDTRETRDDGRGDHAHDQRARTDAGDIGLAAVSARSDARGDGVRATDVRGVDARSDGAHRGGPRGDGVRTTDVRGVGARGDSARGDGAHRGGPRGDGVHGDDARGSGLRDKPRAIPAGALAMAEPAQVSVRIRALLSPDHSRTPLGRARFALLGACAVGLAMLVACATPEPAPVPPAIPDADSHKAAPSAPAAAPSTDSTLDPAIQAIVDDEADRLVSEWKPRAAVVIVLDPNTGHVLAVANRGGETAQHAYVTGSTMKPFVIAAALEEGSIAATDTFDVNNGELPYAGKTIRDASKHRVLDVAGILAVSSNVGLVRIFDKLGGAKLGAWMKRFHLAATVPAIADGSLEGAGIAIGEGLPATPLQLAASFAAIANGGMYRAPVHTKTTSAGERVLSEKTATTVLGFLESVVSGDKGTGKAARVEGVRVAGKTGTAGLSKDHATGYYASFVGTAPIEKPRFVVLVAAEAPRDSGTGGQVAAPVFGRVMNRLLGR